MKQQNFDNPQTLAPTNKYDSTVTHKSKFNGNKDDVIALLVTKINTNPR